MTARYGRSAFKPKHRRLSDRGVFCIPKTRRLACGWGELMFFPFCSLSVFCFPFPLFRFFRCSFSFLFFFFAFRPFPLSSLIFFLFLFSASLFPLSVLLFFHSFLPSIFLLPLCLFSSFFSRVFTFCSQCVNKTPLLL